MNSQIQLISFQNLPPIYKSEVEYILQSNSEPIKKMYSQLHFIYLKCPTIYNGNTEEQVENILQKFFKEIRFITYEIYNIDKNSQSSTLNNIVICSEGKCLIIDSIKSELLDKIFENKNLSKIDVKKDFDVQEEIENLLDNYRKIKRKQLKTINSIISFFIRRYFYPTNFFKKPDFFTYQEHQNFFDKKYKQKVTNYIIKNKNQLEATFPSFNKQILEEMENEQNEQKPQLCEFNESDFIRLRPIGKSKVFLVIHIKTLFIFSMRISNYSNREIDFYKNYSHRCLLKFYGFAKKKSESIFETTQIGIYEFMSNENLLDFVQSNKLINDSYIFMTINRLFQGMNYLHSNKFLHRDLQPVNILIDHDFIPYISDFEYVRDENSSKTITNDIGSLSYASPEQHFGATKLYPSTDIYSFGLIIYFLFEKKDMITKKSIPNMKNASSEIKEFIQNLVNEDPEKRLKNIKIKFFIYEQLKKQLSLLDNFYLEEYLHEYIAFNHQLDSDDFFSFGSFCQYEENDLKRAQEYYEISAGKNNVEANYSLGKLYFYGNGVLKDYHKAKNYFEIAADNNNYKACMLLANIYLEGGESLKDVDKGIECYKKASVEIPMAYNMIGEIYFDFRYGYTDYAIALKYFLKAAEYNIPRTYNFLGTIYYEGLGVEKDLIKAKEYFDKGAKYGEDVSIFFLGKYYYYGEIVELNHETAIKYFLKAANKNYPLAYFYLGNIYRTSPYIPKDYQKAMYYYKQAADKDLYGAWTNIAYMYYFGEGCEKNIEESIKYFEKAANKGNSIALYNLGDIYYNGDGVKKNFVKAKKFFELSAKQDNCDSIFYLGTLYFEGKGVDQNYNKAFDLFNLAVDHPPSLYYLGIMFSHGFGTNIDISKAIECFEKCSKMDIYSYETYNKEESMYSIVSQDNYYVYPSINNIGLIYLFQKENEIKNAELFIRKAGCSCFYFAKNNYGLFNQFYLNNIENAIELYKKSSNEGEFALSEYNIGFIHEKVNDDMKSAVDHYKKALNFINYPLKYKTTIIEDEQFDISKSFIDCFINLKLTIFYLSQSNLKLSEYYFLNALFKPLFKFLFQNKVDSLLFQFKSSSQQNKLVFNLKDFFLNFPLFNLSNQMNFKLTVLNSEWCKLQHSNTNNEFKFKSITIKCQKDQNLEPIFEKSKIKDKFFDEISIPDDLAEKIQNNSNHENSLNDLISNIFKAMNCQDKFEIVDDDIFESDVDSEINVFRFKSEENEIERFVKYPKFLREFFFRNLDDLKNEIIDIVNEMHEMLYKHPYPILFGRLNLNTNNSAANE